jgi:CheY-like chemotaxis protein
MRSNAVNPQHNQPLRILLVEDNEDDVVMLQEAFAGVPLVPFTTVRDGEEALAYLRREGKYKDATLPALILLDIKMPKKNGFEVLREMKADPALRRVPVIMLTTSSREEDVVRSYAEGACSYLQKPIGIMNLQDMARQFALYWTKVSRVPLSAD